MRNRIVWQPKTQDMEREIEALNSWWQQPKKWWQQARQPFTQEPTPPVIRFMPPQPIKPIAKPKVAEEEVTVPFWQRGLQVFAAPFVWIEENIIKPGLAFAGTEAGFVPEVPRMAGEDFWEWKKRSWAGWKAPGIDLDIPWSDEPWRVDIKGVMELAPWLLIPGAGQVGAGARAARGVAGILGKFGTTGRVLGTAIEYSPWGLAEKAVGAGFRAVGKGIRGVSGKAGERLYGKMPEPLPPTVAEVKLATFFKESVIPARKAFKEELPKLRAKQEAVAAEAFASARRGEITFYAAEEQARQALVKVGGIRASFAVKAKQITKEEYEEFFLKINEAAESGLVDVGLVGSLKNTLLGVDLPEPAQIAAFARIFGSDFAKSVGKFARLPVGVKDQVIDALNLPRAVLASADLSATFRQGLILLLTHPQRAPRAFWRQLKGFASEKMSLEMDDALRTHPLYQEAVKDGVEFTVLQRGARLVAKEEPFASNLAQALPLVRRSERAFTTFLNEMRMGAYESAHGAMVAQGASKAEMKLMGSFINIASGRGTLPANLDRYAPVLNTVLFSARYQMSTLQMPRQLGRMLLSKNPYMRKEAAKALITFVGGGSAILGLFNATGRGKVEIDPRSGDFGKIIIGKTRLDIWRGYVQYARFAAQILTAERKSAYGNMNKVQRSEITSRFLQSKASPAFGLMIDLLKGESYMGEPLFNETTGFIKTARDRLLPLALQDVIDAMEQSGVNGVWTAAPATLGIGVLTYVNDLVRVKERIARDMGYQTWDEIDPKTQREIQNTNLELQTAYLDFDRQVMGTAWGDWRNAGSAVEDTFRENVGKATAQYRVVGDGVQFREKISDAFTARRGGYAAREKELRFEDIVKRLNIEDTAESLLSLGPEQLAIKVYTDALYGDDMYDEFGDYRFDEADLRKEQLQQQLGEEMFAYVEEYRGEKYQDLPPEYQELQQAKKVMVKYWDIQKKVERLFGKRWAESTRGKAFISKQRKLMRRTNPEIERYYQMFYSRA